MNLKKNTLLIALSSCFLLSPFSYGQDWSYEIEPYGLISSIEGEGGIGRVAGAPIDVKFGDILENLELGGMIHFEAHKNSGWGLSLDYSFIKLGADFSGPAGGISDIGVRQGLLEALAVNRKEIDGGTLDYLFGVRWWDVDLDVAIDPAVLPGSLMADVEEDWVDLVIGVRKTKEINDRWKYILYGDIGGFGLESDFTATVAAGVHYQINEKWVLDMRYKALWVDYENGTPGAPGSFAYDTVTHGPLMGFIYKF